MMIIIIATNINNNFEVFFFLLLLIRTEKKREKEKKERLAHLVKHRDKSAGGKLEMTSNEREEEVDDDVLVDCGNGDGEEHRACCWD